MVGVHTGRGEADNEAESSSGPVYYKHNETLRVVYPSVLTHIAADHTVDSGIEDSRCRERV